MRCVPVLCLIACWNLTPQSFGQLSFVSHVNDGGNAKCVAVLDQHVCLANHDDFLRVYDVANPKNPVLVGRTTNCGPTYAIAVSKGFVFLASFTNGLRIFNISDPAKPTYATSIIERPRDSNVNDVLVAGDYAYVADSGLYIYDISSPANPKSLWHTNMDTDVVSVAVGGTNAVLASLTRGLSFFNISDPANTRFIARTEREGLPTGPVRIAGNYLYAMNFGDGLRIYDISNPAKPHKVSPKLKQITGLPQSIAISGDYVYEANLATVLQIYDVSHPANPSLYAYARPHGFGCGIAVSSNYVYLANGFNGLTVYSLTTKSKKP